MHFYTQAETDVCEIFYLVLLTTSTHPSDEYVLLRERFRRTTGYLVLELEAITTSFIT